MPADNEELLFILLDKSVLPWQTQSWIIVPTYITSMETEELPKGRAKTKDESRVEVAPEYASLHQRTAAAADLDLIAWSVYIRRPK